MNKYTQILVVDDDEEDRMMLRDFFMERGIDEEVRFAENGLKALEYLGAIPPGQQVPNLVVLDLNMPLMNGTQTLLQMKRDAKLKSIPVVILSTSENETEKRKCIAIGAVDYLVKPVSYEEGTSLLNQLIQYTTIKSRS
jgi:CheY-like chemotaxis protein